jgi:2-alkenal reductase
MKAKIISPTLVLLVALVLAGCGPVVSFGGIIPAVNSQPAAAQAQATATPVSASQPDTAPAQAQVTGALAEYQTAFMQVYDRVNPSVVNIDVQVGNVSTGSNTPTQDNNPFSSPQVPQEGLGSGFVWDAQGHIVTNNHVVENASRVTVTFADGSSVEAQVVGTDPESDLAVLKVDVPAAQLHPVKIADSNAVKVGQVAIAIGDPYGLSGTMTQGIVSALSRSLPVSSDTTGSGSYTIPDIIQTDAAINPGNSGGVLVNIEGEVIGVTAAIRSGSGSNSGIGFVIPSNIVSKVVPALIKDGKVEHPRIGISGTTVTLDIAKSLGLPEGQRGVLVVDVLQNGPAEKAGLQGAGSQANDSGLPTSGDVITAIDGHSVNTFEDLTSYLFTNTQAGQTVTLSILRQGREQTVQLTLGVLSSN